MVRIEAPRSAPLAWALGLGGALALFGLAVLALGRNPFEVAAAVLQSALGTPLGLNRTAARAIPLLLMAAGLLLAFRAKFWHIGMNGCLLVGAMAAAGLALYNPTGPGWLILPSMLVAAVAAGAVWGAVPAVLRLRFGAPEIIVSLLLNYIAQRIADFLVFSYWKDPFGRGFPGTATFNEAFWLPRLPESNLHLGALFAIAALVGAWLVMDRTVWGLRIDLLGQGPRAMEYLGLDTRWVVLSVALIAGALGGLAGAGEVAGLNHRLEAGISQDLGYTAILVVALGQLRPWLTAACAVVVAALLAGGSQLQVQFALPAAMAGVLLWALLYGSVASQAIAARWRHA